MYILWPMGFSSLLKNLYLFAPAAALFAPARRPAGWGQSSQLASKSVQPSAKASGRVMYRNTQQNVPKTSIVPHGSFRAFGQSTCVVRQISRPWGGEMWARRSPPTVITLSIRVPMISAGIGRSGNVSGRLALLEHLGNWWTNGKSLA
jgi:hypothetical protein